MIQHLNNPWEITLNPKDLTFNCMANWFQITPFNERITVIRERLDKIDPRFHTYYTNLYLIKGNKAAILFDTGCGYASIKDVTTSLLDDQELIVINSHNHWDHVGGNHEYTESHIHRLDFKQLMKPMELPFLRSSPSPMSSKYQNQEYTLTFAHENIPLIGDEIFNLGDFEVSVLRTYGHTPGSISLITEFGELFTGDTYHYGAYYVPSQEKVGNLVKSLEDLFHLSDTYDELPVFPGHEQYNIDIDKIPLLIANLSDLDSLDAVEDHYLQSMIYDCPPFLIIRALEDVY